MTQQTLDDTLTREGSATSACGAMGASLPAKYHIIALGLALGPSIDLGTATEVNVEVWKRFDFEMPPTVSGSDAGSKAAPLDTGAAILELRRLSGLTWDQLAKLFHLSRRSLHFWASGKPLNAQNEEHLHRILATIRSIDRGGASLNRMLLLQEHQAVIPFDLLAAGQYEEVVELLGKGLGVTRPKLSPLSSGAQAARAPVPPNVLTDGLQDSVHRDVGHGRAGKSVKIRLRGRE